MPLAPKPTSIPDALNHIELITRDLLVTGTNGAVDKLDTLLAERQQWVEWLTAQPQRELKALPAGLFESWRDRIFAMDVEMNAMFSQLNAHQGKTIRQVALTRKALDQYYVPQTNTSALGIEDRA